MPKRQEKQPQNSEEEATSTSQFTRNYYKHYSREVWPYVFLPQKKHSVKASISKIAINATLTRSNPTGLGIYTNELTSALLKAESPFDFSVYSLSTELQNLCPDKIHKVNAYISPASGFKGNIARLIWQQTILPLKLKKDNIKLLYSTVNEGILNPRLKQIVTVHDILPIRFSKGMHPRYKYYFRYIVPILLKNSHSIICVSKSTKNDVIDYYGIKNKPIHVIHEGFNKEKFYPHEKGFVNEKLGSSQYLLCIGDMRPYKNLENTLEAFAALNIKDLKFVIGGHKDPRFYPAIIKKVNELSLGDRVILPGYVTEEYLPHLYSEASAFIFTSLHEGFGLPPLEAMACGCPVVASNTASMPEVCGDAAYYVDPHSVDSIAEGMYKVLSDNALREGLTRKGLERVKLFSWERSAKEHLKVFEEVLNS